MSLLNQRSVKLWTVKKGLGGDHPSNQLITWQESDHVTDHVTRTVEVAVKMGTQYLAVLLSLFAVVGASYPGLPPRMCLKMSPCGADCYSTCDNPCQCDLTRSGKVPFPIYRGVCRSTGFCEMPAPSLEDCVSGGVSLSRCPAILNEEEAVQQFTQFKFRIDVRSVEEWDIGHSSISLHTDGLATNPAVQYDHVLSGREDDSVLVYCRSGRRAFHAGLNLLRYGFSSVSVLHPGGYPTLSKKIVEQSERDPYRRPSKALCYLTGGSAECPTPLPISHINSSSYLLSLGDNVILIDVRPKYYTQTLNRAVRLPKKMKKMKKFLNSFKEKRDTLVLFGERGDQAFSTAKEFIKRGWRGVIYFVDNGGYAEIRDLFKRGYRNQK